MVMTIVMFGLFVVVVLLGLAHIAELRRRGRAEREAIDSERRYRLLAESSFDMIVRFDPSDQRRTYISPACHRLYGYEPDEALSMSAEVSSAGNGRPITSRTGSWRRSCWSKTACITATNSERFAGCTR